MIAVVGAMERRWLKNREKERPLKGRNLGGLVLDSSGGGTMIAAGLSEQLGARGRISAVLDEEEYGTEWVAKRKAIEKKACIDEGRKCGKWMQQLRKDGRRKGGEGAGQMDSVGRRTAAVR